MCPYLASIDDFGSISPVWKGLRQAGPGRWVWMHAQFQPGRALTPCSQPLSMQTHLVYTARGQRIRSAASKGADMPARRWIYSTNKSAHHAGFSGGLHLLGHTCAHRHVQQRYINTCASCPKNKCKSVTSHHTQLWISTRVHSYTRRWKRYITNSASLIPGCLRSPGFGLHRNEGWWDEGWIKFANLRWDQRPSGRREWSWRSNRVNRYASSSVRKVWRRYEMFLFHASDPSVNGFMH